MERITSEDFLDTFAILDQSQGTWLEAGKLSRKLKNKGETALLLDCYIAGTAKENACAIFILDSRLEEIQRTMPITLF